MARRKGLFRHLWERVKAIPSEVAATLTDKVIPQGSAELAQALYTGQGYVPYGPGQKPLAVEAPPRDHEAMLNEHAARGARVQQQRMPELER